jgi:glutamine synthetase
MTRKSAPATALAAGLDRLDAEIIHAGMFDYMGMFRQRRLRRETLLAGAETAVFANVVAKWDVGEEVRFPGPYRSEAVTYDAASLRPNPFEPKAAYLVADFAGEQAELMPRRVLRSQLEKAARLGFEVEAAFEFEFIVLDETAASLREKDFAGLTLAAADNRCWSGITAAVFAPFISELETCLSGAGVAVHSLSGELGPGCFEATLGRQTASRAADDAAFFRMITKAFCRLRGLTAAFMPYLGTGFPGIGGHVTLSLLDRKSRTNRFADIGAPHGLSATARSFLAGVIATVPEAFPLCAQTVNAYRRLAPGSWAPKTMSWAPYNYAAAVRAASETEAMTRLEFRLPGSDCNPFLALALVLGCGLDGIERTAELTAEPIAGGGPGEIPPGQPRLPADLLEATRRMRASADARRLFGAPFIDHFAAWCEAEDAALRRAVSPEEVRRYLEAG